MRLLWLCNLIPGTVQQAIDGTAGNGLWIDHTLEDLLAGSAFSAGAPKPAREALGN